MTELPTSDSLTDANVSTEVWKLLLRNVREFITQLPGANALVTPTLENSKITPTVAVNAIKLSGENQTGTLTNINISAIPDGEMIFVTALTEGAKITVKHNFGGNGSILLFRKKDIVLTNQFTLLLIRVGNNWQQINTSGYIFNSSGLIDYALLPVASQSVLGLAQYATDSEYNAGTATNRVPNVKQIKSSINSINTTITNKVIFPVGFETITRLKVAPTGWLFEQGNLISRTQYAELWNWANSNGLVVSETSWQNNKMYGMFSTGDGSTTMRIPDMRALYPVGYLSGTNTLGKYIADTIKNITGTFQYNRVNMAESVLSGAFYVDGNYAASGNTTSGGDASRVVNFDASRVVATSDRVQPRSVPVNFMIKYRNL